MARRRKAGGGGDAGQERRHAPDSAGPPPSAAVLRPEPAAAISAPLDPREERVKRAAHLLLFRRGRRPGAREWELRQRLGKDWEDAVKRLNDALAPLDVEVRRAEEPGLDGDDPGVRYLAVLKGTMKPADARMTGIRIDNLAALAISISFVLAKQGRAPREEVEDLLSERLGRWRSGSLLDFAVRAGYLSEDDDGMLALGWRSYAEVDVRSLMGKLLAMKPEARTDETGSAAIEKHEASGPERPYEAGAEDEEPRV